MVKQASFYLSDYSEERGLQKETAGDQRFTVWKPEVSRLLNVISGFKL